jgi:hypothetical protein
MKTLVIENIHETKNYALLKKTYKEILIPCFPNPEDHLTWQRMKYMAKDGIENSESNAKVLIAISKHYDEKKNEIPVSFFVVIYYKKSQTALISYMGMRGGCKGLSASNIQNEMLAEIQREAARNNQKLKGVFSLVDLPEHANLKYITIPPLQRIIFMERHGAVHIPIDFYYPTFQMGWFTFLNPKLTYKNDAALLGYNIGGVLPTQDKSVIKNFIHDFYSSYKIESSNNEIITAMHDEIDSIPYGQALKLSAKYRKITSKRHNDSDRREHRKRFGDQKIEFLPNRRTTAQSSRRHNTPQRRHDDTTTVLHRKVLKK